jgi:hypothetical protein
MDDAVVAASGELYFWNGGDYSLSSARGGRPEARRHCSR